MSIFRRMNLACPKCAAPVEFEAVFSVNADRRPDLRAAILDGTFQEEPCPKCGAKFRLDPEFTFINVKRGQWIAVLPIARLDEWTQAEARIRADFDKGYGPKAPKGAQELGKNLKPRLVFGFEALVEKLVILDNRLDDVVIELVKTAILRGVGDQPIGPGMELRLQGVDGADLIFAWMDSETGEVVEILEAPRTLYDEIVQAPQGWEGLRADLTAGLFVDINRLLMAPIR